MLSNVIYFNVISWNVNLQNKILVSNQQSAVYLNFNVRQMANVSCSILYFNVRQMAALMFSVAVVILELGMGLLGE